MSIAHYRLDFRMSVQAWNRHEGYDTGMPDYEDTWVTHPRGRMFVRCWRRQDKRPPILLLHDSLGCVELWRSFPAALSERTGRRVIAYDRLGFGRSDERRDRLQMDFVADEASLWFPAVREQLGVDRFVLLGHSVGGGMAVHCAAQFAGACDAVITESAQALVEEQTLSSIAEVRDSFRQDGQMERLKKYHGEKAAWVLSAWADTWLSAEFRDWSLRQALPRVKCPLLAIHGDKDEYGSQRHPETIAALAGGGAILKLMPETRHVPHREREAEVADMAAEFLGGLRDNG